MASITLEKGYKTTAIMVAVLTIFLTFGAWIGRSSVSANAVQNHDAAISKLKEQVDDLKLADTKMAVLQEQIKDIKESQLRTEKMMEYIQTRVDQHMRTGHSKK